MRAAKGGGSYHSRLDYAARLAILSRHGANGIGLGVGVVGPDGRVFSGLARLGPTGARAGGAGGAVARFRAPSGPGARSPAAVGPAPADRAGAAPELAATKPVTVRFFLDRIVPEAAGLKAGATAGADLLYALPAAALVG